MKDIEVEDNLVLKRGRSRISNLVKRRNIDKSCRRCGKPARMIYNREDPYKVAFLCTECRRDPNNWKDIERYTIDLREALADQMKEDMWYKRVTRLGEDEIASIREEYKTYKGSLANYCKLKGLSRYQLRKILEELV